MKNFNPSVGTTAEKSTTVETQDTSSHSNGNTFVASSFNVSNLTQHPSTFAAYKMLQQLDEKNDGSGHWMLMSLHKLLVECPNLTVKDLITKIEIICPNAKSTVNERLQEHGYFN